MFRCPTFATGTKTKDNLDKEAVHLCGTNFPHIFPHFANSFIHQQAIFQVKEFLQD